MPNKKISALTALAVAPATNDLVPIVDVSDTTDAATGTTKKITVANLFTSPTFSDFTNANHDHGDADDGGQLTDSALSTAVGIAKGGTGQVTNTAAFDALAPTTTAGDTMYHNGSDNIRLAKGTAGQSLVMNSGATAPEWGGIGTNYVGGALENSIVKTYFNVQLLFILWTGASDGDLTTPFDNWIRTTEVTVTPGGAFSSFVGTGAESIYVTNALYKADQPVEWNDTHIVIMDWWARLPATSTGDINMGFTNLDSVFQRAYNSSTNGFAGFSMRGSTGVIYATISKNAVGVTNTDVSSGITNTNFNNFRIEFDISNEVKFYINGTLKATLSGANLTTSESDMSIGFGRSDTAAFVITAPNISLQMNP